MIGWWLKKNTIYGQTNSGNCVPVRQQPWQPSERALNNKRFLMILFLGLSMKPSVFPAIFEGPHAVVLGHNCISYTTLTNKSVVISTLLEPERNSFMITSLSFWSMSPCYNVKNNVNMSNEELCRFLKVNYMYLSFWEKHLQTVERRKFVTEPT